MRSYLTVALLAVSAPASAHDWGGFYAGAFANFESGFTTDFNNTFAAGVFGGYNFHSGLVFGIEGSASTFRNPVESQLVSRLYIDQSTFPFPTISTTVPPNWPPPFTDDPIEDWTYILDLRERTELSVDHQALFHFRVGAPIDNLLLYGKVGGGVSSVTLTEIRDDTNSIYCESAPTRVVSDRPDSYRQEVIGCEGRYRGGETRDSATQTRPTMAIALGGEYAFEQFFGRIETGFAHTFYDAGGISQYHLTIGFGVSF